MTEPANTDGYDVIGDVHGHAEKLVALLTVMGYEPKDGAWRHPNRQAVFVGDLIDRGPDQIGTVAIARAMVEAGSAHIVIGNHEFNAIAYATPDPIRPGRHLRSHSEKHQKQHRAFLDQVGLWSTRHSEMLDWFETLPLWLELDGLRVVHGCWDPAKMRELAGLVGEADSLTPALVERASRKDSVEWEAIEHLLKGPEIEIRESYVDKDGHSRDRARFAWWIEAPDDPAAAVVIPANVKNAKGDPYHLESGLQYEPPVAPYTDSVPVIYGHYWETGDRRVSTERTACVDYSAANGGPLVAYRWSGETELVDENFVAGDDAI